MMLDKDETPQRHDEQVRTILAAEPATAVSADPPNPGRPAPIHSLVVGAAPGESGVPAGAVPPPVTEAAGEELAASGAMPGTPSAVAGSRAAGPVPGPLVRPAGSAAAGAGHRAGTAAGRRVPPGSDGITPPLRIAAVAIGIALVAVPLTTTTLGGGRMPAHKRPAATFRVGDRDVNTYWPAPAAAGH